MGSGREPDSESAECNGAVSAGKEATIFSRSGEKGEGCSLVTPPKKISKGGVEPGGGMQRCSSLPHVVRLSRRTRQVGGVIRAGRGTDTDCCVAFSVSRFVGRGWLHS